MKPADADYQSFLVRIWREDQEKTGAAGDGWLFQLEDIAGGDARYFHTIGELADYVDEKLRMDAGKPH